MGDTQSELLRAQQGDDHVNGDADGGCSINQRDDHDEARLIAATYPPITTNRLNPSAMKTMSFMSTP